MRSSLAALALLISATAWSQNVSQQAKADCETLMNEVLGVAKRMLREHGEFFPYGGAMEPTGEIVSVSGYDGREQPPSADIIRLIRGAFVDAAAAGTYKATALVYDVRVTSRASGVKSDAIAVALDHRDQYSVVVFFPYQLVNGELRFGEVFAQQGERNVFAAQ